MYFNNKHESSYTALKSKQRQIPVVLADLGYGFGVYKRLVEINKNNLILAQVDWIIGNIISYKKMYNQKTTAERELKLFNLRAKENNFPTAKIEDIKYWFLNEYGKDIDAADLAEIDFIPKSKGKKLNVFYYTVGRLIRDPFMLKNIELALNKYDTVFVCFGEGHYRSQKGIIEDSLGVPEYILNVTGKDSLDLRDFINIETLI